MKIFLLCCLWFQGQLFEHQRVFSFVEGFVQKRKGSTLSPGSSALQWNLQHLQQKWGEMFASYFYFFKRLNQFNTFNKDVCLLFMMIMMILERSVQCFNASGTLKFCHLKYVITIIGTKVVFITVRTNVDPYYSSNTRRPFTIILSNVVLTEVAPPSNWQATNDFYK